MKIQLNTFHVSRTGDGIQKKLKNFLRMDKNERIDRYENNVLNNFKKTILSEDIVNYPQEHSLIKALSNFFNVKETNVLITPGSDAGLKYIFETFVQKKNKVASLTPSYAMFEFYADLFKSKLLKVYYDENFNVDEKDIKKVINKKIKIFYIANPNQPSGTSLEDKKVKKILDLSSKKNFLVIIDEAYVDFSSHSSKINLIKKYKNLFIIRTFSKGYGSAGLRVGCIFSNEKNIEEVNKVRPLHNVNSIGLKFASYLLKNNQILKKNIKNINQSKSMVYNFCKKNNLNFLNSDTNFINIFFSEQTCKNIQSFLRKKKILVRLRNFNTKNKKFFSIRVSLGYKNSTLKFLNKLSLFIKLNEKKN
tara:strand:- start:2203 stop:3291 length:1089 start_codon:yes stop_codon:yes gene_type:complete